MKKILSIHYDEIALKGKQRGYFQSILIKNIEKKLGEKVRAIETRLIMENYNPAYLDKIIMTPGISWVSEAYSIEKDEKELIKILSEVISDERQINLDVKRVDKGYSKTSVELKEELAKTLGIHFDKNGKKIRIEIMHDSFIINYNIIKCIGGMPIRSSGKVISLFSGGIDSAIAPIEIMKRGATVDLLHVYALNSPDAALDGKINEIVKKLGEIEPGIKLYLVPFHYFSVSSLKINKRYELVMFKRFLLKLAERIAVENGYQAITSGDSLAQVASQTIENINAISYGIDLPVFRPFIGYNKSEIIDKSKKYGLYDLSIEDYKDCCSIVSRNPATKSNDTIIKKLEKEINMDKIINDSINDIKIVKY
ncbi:MAG: thiamine biosynthesis protein [Candidatus Parvarchaeum acidophilus ARMAN-5]|uniref:Probable tRNA sulfurtransferase n=1 Tax=Candidatus Parvarchaeum acidophilus ARMAN-5 TaxID=662762 RepID=D6GWF1_PARA5|nr:MAG: thiamine biosynthesis protein [Candidatus Parvarchaeum acidophilus ARMAN-5]